jgi:uroporphyrinogen-III synthase
VASSLGNKSVVITRSIAQNESLRHLLEARGAEVVEVPLIAIAEPDDDGRERDEVLQRFHEFDWLVVTSPNGAERVAPFLAAAQAAGDATQYPSIAAVGDATARSLGTAVSLIAQPARAEALAHAFPIGQGSVLLVQGNLADDSLAQALVAKGWTVNQVVAYQTVQLRPAADMVQPALSADVLLLASGSAATGWCEAFGTSTPSVVVAIGPSTAKVAEALGIDVSAVASEQTLESLLETAERLLESQNH